MATSVFAGSSPLRNARSMTISNGCGIALLKFAVHVGDVGVPLGRVDDRGQHRGPFGRPQHMSEIRHQRRHVRLETSGVRSVERRAERRAGVAQQVGPGRPMPIDRGLRDARAARDFIDGRAAKAALEQELRRDAEHGGTRAADPFVERLDVTPGGDRRARFGECWFFSHDRRHRLTETIRYGIVSYIQSQPSGDGHEIRIHSSDRSRHQGHGRLL